MTVSIIIPTLNEETTIAQTLQHLHTLPRHGIALEILVVDGGSRDQTLALVNSPTRILSTSPSRAKQMNTGAEEALGEILLFLHADTLLPNTALQDMQTALSNPSIVGGRFNARTDHDVGLLWLVCQMVNFRSRVTRIATGDQGIFVRRSVFHSMGGYADIPLMEDIDFSRRMKAEGSIATLKSCVITSARRWKTNGILQTIFLMWAFRLLFFIGFHPKTLKRLYSDIR